MIKDVIDAGGPSVLIPVVLFVLMYYIIRGLFGLHGRHSQHRSEFLERWNPRRLDDDLWLEVIIRHLYGTALPAHAIRTAIEHPHTSQALAHLSDLWPLLDYEADTRKVRWKHWWHRQQTIRKALRYWPVFRYFAFAGAAAVGLHLAASYQGLHQWIFSTFTIIMAACAFLSLWHGEADRTAASVGDSWIQRINTAALLPRETEAEVRNSSAGE